MKQVTKKQRERKERRASAVPQAVVIVRCIVCRAKREVKAGEIAPGDVPHCTRDMCFGICVAEKAIVRTV